MRIRTGMVSIGGMVVSAAVLGRRTGAGALRCKDGRTDGESVHTGRRQQVACDAAPIGY